LPGARSAEIAGTGHMAPLTHPDLVNPIIERFIEGGP
jgi:pimeloyl-ACP methyl ester carboxylesterase